MPITLQTLKKLLTVPHEILPKIAKAKNMNEAVVMLVINWVLLTVGFALASQNYSIIPAVLVFGIIGTLIAAFFIQVALTVIGGKGDYASTLIASTYPFFGVALSSLIVSMIFLWSSRIAAIIGAFLFVLYFTVAFTGAFRVLKESFKLDIVTLWVATSLLVLAIFGSMYLMASIYIFKSGAIPSLFNSIAYPY
jgi:hypothetical protein